MTGFLCGFFDQKCDYKFYIILQEKKKNQSDCWVDKPHYTCIINVSNYFFFLSKHIVFEL